MIAYKIILSGTNQEYFVTKEMKESIESALNGNNNGIIHIYDDIVRSYSVKEILQFELDEATAPEYFRKRLEFERKKQKPEELSEEEKQLRDLPTEIIYLDTNFKPILYEYEFLTDTEFHKSGDKIKVPCSKKNFAPFGMNRWLLACCHYRVNSEGLNEYIIEPSKIKSLYACQKNYGTSEVFMERVRWHYGQEHEIKQKKNAK